MHLREGPFHAFRHEERICLYEEAAICIKRRKDDPSIIVPDEERVEDAGLNFEEAPSKPKKRQKATA